MLKIKFTFYNKENNCNIYFSNNFFNKKPDIENSIEIIFYQPNNQHKVDRYYCYCNGAPFNNYINNTKEKFYNILFNFEKYLNTYT